MPSPREKFQELVSELFQFKSADLDFGIYRIMNFKRDAIERFIQEDLIEAVDKELSSGMLASQSQAALELKKVAAQIRETLGETALNGDDSLEAAYNGTPLGKHYLELQARASQAQERPAFEAIIFNHLYAFFSRYYDNGDFLSKRRYSRREKYAIPYNGEEVYLHWANNDQYYVKTGEYFNDYRFKSPYGISVHFKLVAADVEKDNVKGDKRFFVPLPHEVTFDEEKKEITIPFQYRPLTEQEEIKYGQRNQQDVITKEALITIPAKLEKDVTTLPALLSAHHTTADGQQVNYLEYHLRRYTRRNTSDFFVHTDLKGFLKRELDFYLKNEVLNLDEMEATGEPRSEAWFQIIHVVRSIGGRVIEFLAQLEDFQKRLFEKRKFILETQYCITIANVPEDFYAEIAECEAQWQEWKELFHLDEEQPNLFTSAAKNRKKHRIAALKEHPTLVLDTKHFDQQFKDRLLATYDNLDELTDGLLVHSENFQALNLLKDKYHEKIKCIYIDPPFNTGTNEFLYKNDYLNSSWLAMLNDRVRLGKSVLSNNGNFFCRIDHHGDFWVRQLLDNIFSKANYQNQMILKRGRETAGTRGKLEIASESLYWFSANDSAEFNKISVDRSIADVQWTAFLMGGERHPRERTFLGKTLTPPSGQHFSLVQEKVNKLLEQHFIRVRCSNCGAIYFYADSEASLHQTMKRKGNRYKYYDITPGKTVHGIRVLYHCLECRKDDWRVDYLGAPTVNLSNIWLDIESYANTTGFFTENSEALLQRVIKLASNESETVLDFFLGSGTTVAVAHKLRRKWVGIEAGEYFYSIPLLRMKKVLAGNGAGISRDVGWTGGGVFKYVHLESYEDALNNITFPDVPKTLYDFDDYLLKYMLVWETKENETLLNVEKLATPFSYKLIITTGEETQEKPVDIPETFTYLLGLNVRTRRVYHDENRYYLVYRGNIDHREIAVIWRETSGWNKADYERDKQFVEEQKLTEGVDEVFVNGDNYIPEARSLESVFKNRMFGSL